MRWIRAASHKTTPSAAQGCARLFVRSFSLDGGTTTQSPEEILAAFANLDHTRSRRTGFPEAVFAESKTPEQVISILDDMARNVDKTIEREGAVCDMAASAILATR
jgi:hypothetical protein